MQHLELKNATVRPMLNWNKMTKLILESRNITVDSQFEAPESVSKVDDVMQTGFLQYSATVVDTEIGKDQFTEVVIKPLHHLSNIFIT